MPLLLIKKIFFAASIFLFSKETQSQNLGGSYTYGFLKLSNTAPATALGGNVITQLNTNLSPSFQNPALLQPTMHKNLNLSFQNLYAGVKNMESNYILHNTKYNTTLQAAVQFINYGSSPLTNAAGNIQGDFSANDYVVQVSASRSYLERWRYGVTLKLIGSNYGSESSYAIATDCGTTYTDSANGLQLGMLFKNIGVQLKPYTSKNKEPLPFDLQFGICKKLKKAPVQFVATITNFHQFDIRYADTTFENEINGTVPKGKFTFDKLMRHVTIGTQVFPSKNTVLSIAYNYLRRKELGLYNIGNGATGFSLGAGYSIQAYTLNYAAAFYFNNKPFHQLSLGIDFSKLKIRR